jgi:DNA-binding NtrC family response regulator
MVLPVILTTGRLPVEELAQNPSLQLAALLPKPFSNVKLLETVRIVLGAPTVPPDNSNHRQTGEANHRLMI